MTEQTRELDVELHRSWFVSGELPMGMLCSLLLTAWSQKARAEPTTNTYYISLTIGEALAPGRAELSAAIQSGVGRSCLDVSLRNHDGPGRLGASIDPLDAAIPMAGLPLVPLGPEDVLPFTGGRPGAAGLFEIRPLPYSGHDRGTAAAWVRPIESDERLPLGLLAADAWLPPTQLDDVRDQLDAIEARPLNSLKLRSARLQVDQTAAFTDDDRWLLLRSAVCHRSDGMSLERGRVDDQQGICIVHFEAERQMR